MDRIQHQSRRKKKDPKADNVCVSAAAAAVVDSNVNRESAKARARLEIQNLPSLDFENSPVSHVFQDNQGEDDDGQQQQQQQQQQSINHGRNNVMPGAVHVRSTFNVTQSQSSITLLPDDDEFTDTTTSTRAIVHPFQTDTEQSSQMHGYGYNEYLVNAMLVEDHQDEGNGNCSTPPPPPSSSRENFLVDAIPLEEGRTENNSHKYESLFKKVIWLLVLIVASAVALGVVFSQRARGGDGNTTPTPPPTTTTTTVLEEAENIFKTFGIANTSSFWDCSGGACGCGFDPLDNMNQPAYCHGNILFRAPANNTWNATFYGTAAISQDLGGGFWLGEGCGKCWTLKGTNNVGDFSRSTADLESIIVVKGSNFCPPNDCPSTEFVIAAPGFTRNGPPRSCDEREINEVPESFATCSEWMLNETSNPEDNCDCSVFNDTILRDGCENYLSLGWNDVDVEFEEVECPEELKRLPCWEENGEMWPPVIAPDLCASPFLADGR